MSGMNGFIDTHGVIAQGPPHRDGGDSCQRRFMYRVGMWLRGKMKIKGDPLVKWWRPSKEETEEDVPKFYKRGQIRRHPNDTAWYGKWNRGSRDQTIPFLAWCGADKQYKHAFTYVFWHFFRVGWIERIGEKVLPFRLPVWLPMLTTNNWIRNWIDLDNTTEPEWKKKSKLPDPTLMEFWALEIRAMGLWMLYPLLCVLDFENLVATLFWKWGRKDDNDVLNHVIVTSYIQHKYPTPLGWLSRKLLDWKSMDQKMYNYFYAHPEDIKDMHTLWKPIMEKMGE